jgi:hypothetical protein
MISTIVYLCVLVCSQESIQILLKIVDLYPLALQVRICSLEPYIEDNVLDYLLSIGFQDTIGVLLVISIHMEMSVQY